MPKPKNRTIPQIPRPSAFPAAADNNVETKPASALTKAALQLLLERYQREANDLANQAAEVEGMDPKQGWKLSTDGVWFREKPKA